MKNLLVAGAMVFGLTVVAANAHADMLPHRDGRGVPVYKCTDVDADKAGQGPDQSQVDQFLKNPAYSSSTEQSVTKQPNGGYRVCALFKR